MNVLDCVGFYMSIDTLLNRLDGIKTNGTSKWLAKCPAHSDRTPSLAIKLTDDEKILLKCWSGCDTHSILNAIGLTFEDLFPPKNAQDFHNEGYKRKKSNVPRFSPYEMFPVLVQEAIIACMAADTLMNNKPLSDADFQRVKQAFQTVNRLNSEYRAK
jgi:hypothetical protein